MKTPSPACFKEWGEHDVIKHVEWFKHVRPYSVFVQFFGNNWGYLVTEMRDDLFVVIDGRFSSDWSAMDACAKAEEAFARATEGIEPANALLIAASPELFASCREMREFIHTSKARPGETPYDILCRASFAIAKATGGTL